MGWEKQECRPVDYSKEPQNNPTQLQSQILDNDVGYIYSKKRQTLQQMV